MSGITFRDSFKGTARPQSPTADALLIKAAETFKSRNAVYGNNYMNVGPVMDALFPFGVRLESAEDFTRWHLFELIVVKLTRFANSGLLHKDSIHDATVYAAMVESLIEEDTLPIEHSHDHQAE